MTDEHEAVDPDESPDTEPQEQQRVRTGHARPVDRGPGQHHGNADTRRSATQQSKVTHEF